MKKEKSPAKGPLPKKFTSKVKFSQLEDAIKDGKFLGQIGSELIIEKLRDGKRQMSVCVVKAIEGTKIDTFDHTCGQWFTFTCEGLEKYGIIVKLNS